MTKAQTKNNETDKARRDSQGTSASPSRVAPSGQQTAQRRSTRKQPPGARHQSEHDNRRPRNMRGRSQVCAEQQAREDSPSKRQHQGQGPQTNTTNHGSSYVDREHRSNQPDGPAACVATSLPMWSATRSTSHRYSVEGRVRTLNCTRPTLTQRMLNTAPAERPANHLRKGHRQDLEARKHTIHERRRSAASVVTFKPAKTLLPLSSGALACWAATARNGTVAVLNHARPTHCASGTAVAPNAAKPRKVLAPAAPGSTVGEFGQETSSLLLRPRECPWEGTALDGRNEQVRVGLWRADGGIHFKVIRAERVDAIL